MDQQATIVDLKTALLEPEALLKDLQKCEQNDNISFRIIPSDRKPNGWLEWFLYVQFISDSMLCIAMVQRTVGAEYEFHT